MSDYSIHFHTLAGKWSLAASVDTFLHGLAACIKDALVAYEVPGSLNGAIDLAIQVDLRVQARLGEKRKDEAPSGGRRFPATPQPAALSREEGPLQLGRTSFTGKGAQVLPPVQPFASTVVDRATSW